MQVEIEKLCDFPHNYVDQDSCGAVDFSGRRPSEGVDFDKRLSLLPLKMLIFLPNKDFIPLPH